MAVKMTAVIIRGNERWERPMHGSEIRKNFNKICSETEKQRNSDQWLQMKGFKKV